MRSYPRLAVFSGDPRGVVHVSVQRRAAVSDELVGEDEVRKLPAVEALAWAAVDSELVRTAAHSCHWREVYIGIPYGEGVLEGYIDLLYEDDDGLVIVDYKTDAVSGPAELDEKVERYSVQLRAYAQAMRVAVGRPVARALLLFLSIDRASVREVDLGLL